MSHSVILAGGAGCGAFENNITVYKALNFFNGAAESFNWSAYYLRKGFESAGYDSIANEQTKASMGGSGTAYILEGTALRALGAVWAGSRLRAAAMAEANAAQKMPGSIRPGAAGAVETPSGNIYTGRSIPLSQDPNLAPEVQAAYDQVPMRMRSEYHSRCFEGQCASNAFRAGDNTRNGMITGFYVRSPNNRNYGLYAEPCPSCRYMANILGITAILGLENQAFSLCYRNA